MGDNSASGAHFNIICEEVKPGDVAQFAPGKLQKVVHFIRHGQGTHNVYAEEVLRVTPNENPYLSPLHEDAKLTQKGRLEATTIAPKLVRTKPIPQLAFVSPLRRTLQTATIGFSTLSHFQIALVADEMIRERMGVHPCDKRTNVEAVKKLFKDVDFSAIPPGEDSFSTTVRESEEQTAQRGKSFLMQLKDRTEESFAIVTHSSFLFNTLNKALITPDEKVARRFSTGEVRCVLLTYEPVC